jgi:hypothetical protein
MQEPCPAQGSDGKRQVFANVGIFCQFGDSKAQSGVHMLLWGTHGCALELFPDIPNLKIMVAHNDLLCAWMIA